MHVGLSRMARSRSSGGYRRLERTLPFGAESFTSAPLHGRTTIGYPRPGGKAKPCIRPQACGLIASDTGQNVRVEGERRS